MIELRDKETGKVIGQITEAQLQFLIDQLEEEYDEDRDYYINKATLAMFKDRGIDDELQKLLTKALGKREDMEIEWSR